MPTKKSDIPKEFDLCASGDALGLNIEAAVAGEESKPRRFDMVAYNGGMMRIGGFWYPVVVDLSGLSITKKSKPIFLQHTQDIEYLLGQTDTLKIEDNSLRASGKILGNSDKVKQVLELNDAGYKWQASIGARVEEYQFIKEKETVAVNGKTFKGPLYCITKSSLGEISFVMLGADESTSARIAATYIEESSNMAKEKNLEATAVDTPEEVVAEAKTEEVKASKPETSQADDVVGQIRAASAAEMTRIAEVGKICGGNHAEIQAKAISEGWSKDKTELEVLRASRPTAPNGIVYDRTITPAILEAAAIMAGGISGDELLAQRYDEKVVNAADKRFHGRIGLQQLLMECARANGCSVMYFMDNPKEVLRFAFGNGMINAAFSTLDLSGILSNTANKYLVKGFDAVENTYERISSWRPVKDFKQITGYRLNGGFEFLEVGPDGELTHATTSEDSFTNQAKTHGIMYSITRTDIINDDLGALIVIPMRIGRGGALKVNTVFWTEFLNNSSFFTSGRGNYASGSGSALGIDGLTAADLLFRNQTDPDGKPTAIAPKILLVPNAKFILAKQLMVSTKLKGSTDGPDENPFSGMYNIENSAYLSNSSFTGHSSTAWYLLADPNDMPVIERVYLNGVKKPTVESADANFNILGVEMRGYFDFGMTKQEYRGGVKMAGA